MNVYLHDPVFALGDTSYSVEQAVAAARTVSSANTLRDAGFRAHHVCSPDTGVQDLAVNLDEFTGKPVEVLADVTPGSHDGRVEFKGATWSARSHEPIRKGEAARIERVDGLVLVVRKEREEEA